MASFFDFASWFGPELRSGADTKPTSQVLGGKAVVGLYFSAHWCPPCRGFTPKLAALYEALVAAGESFEVVFVSSDRDDAQFDEYYGAHPLGGRAGKGPGGPGPTFGSLPGPVLLYFSAHWCPPCRQFTPQLVAFFSRLKAAHPAASLVFVSSDKSEHEFAEYFADMGDEWLALPFAARGAKDRLSQLFGVRGIRRSRSSLVVFAEAMADPSAAIGALKALAAKHAAVDPPELLFFFAELPEGPVDKVRELCGIAGLQGRAETADLVLLDIPDDGGFYLREKVASVDVAALEAFLASPGDRKQLEAG
ncbi:hypothetical protein JL721_5840 [Aureococcus anophagefferens]|nr:hypothetical protein JL721_5840 [Aureococcus anophagefferens]